MTTTLVIVVYNRYDNLKHWLHCLSLCPPVRVVVIHNCDEPAPEYEALCKDVQYIRRPNIGYDIGAFQDVCNGLIEWERVLWVTDDTFPMCTDFVQRFESAHTHGTVTAMKISPYVREHIRTTGFMIDRETGGKLKFPADPITTKEHCYQFEHRSPTAHFLTQVKAFQVADDPHSPLWDVGYHRKLDRAAEHIAVFGEYPKPEIIEQKEKTTIICPIYKSFPAVISSLIMQTNTNWELWLIHDGPGNGEAEQYVNTINDDRIKYFETPTHSGNWGHSIRSEWLQKVTSKYVMVTNPDNYYSPVFIQKALAIFSNKTRYVGVYSGQMVHSYKDWHVIPCRMHRGYIDCGGIVLKAKEAKATGWKNTTDHSADWFFFKDLIAAHGLKNFVSFPGCNFIHN